MFGPLRAVGSLTAVAVVCLTLALLIAGVDAFRETRIDFFEARLEKRIGVPVRVEGDVRFSFEPELVIVATQVVLPSPSIANFDLARLKKVSFALVPKRGVSFPSIYADGLTVDLLTKEDGTRSWSVADSGGADVSSISDEIFQFLGERDVAFSDFDIASKNEDSGFEFDIQLQGFSVLQHEGGARTELNSKGAVNGEAFDIAGSFPRGDQFKVSGAAGDLDFSLQGKKSAGGPAGDFLGVLAVNSSDLQNLLDLLKLQAGFGGQAVAKAKLMKTGSLFELSSIDSKVTLTGGNTIALTGTISEDPINKATLPDFDVNVVVDFEGSSQSDDPAVYFTDIRPKTLKLHLTGQDTKWTIDQLELDTNAFDEDLQKIGPFHSADIERSDSGFLQVKGIAFHIGPDTHPFATITGDIGDLLDFRKYTFEGELDLPARFLLPDIPAAAANELGTLMGSFKVEDKGGNPEISHMNLNSAGSDIWSAKFSMDAESLSDLSTWELSANFDVPNGTNFLKALQLRPVASGAIHYSTKINFGENNLHSITDVSVGSSAVHSDLSLGVLDGAPQLTGKVHSSSLQLRDINHAAQIAKEMTALADDFDAVFSAEADIGLKQSVEGAWSDLQENTAKEPVVAASSGNNTDKVAIQDVVHLHNLLESNFLAVDVTVDKFSGIPGLTKVKSKLTGQKGHLTLSPLTLALGEGRASVSAGVDLIKAPKRVSVDGKGQGWDLGDVIKEAGLKIPADGDIHAQFDFSGGYTSPKDFFDTLRGNAKIELENGEIGTSLIELSGLGILRWLFSEELAHGASKISCIKADMHFADGEMKFNDMVLETQRVQLVASGTIDYVKDTIDIEANPRGLGHPLSRSAWPFTVTGSLQHPMVKAHFGKMRRWSPQVLEMPPNRVPCVPDVQQLKPVPRSQ